MQPLYFLAGVTQATLVPGNRLCRTLLTARGLAGVFADVGEGDYAASELSGRGPGDRSGTILSYLTPAGKAARRLGYFPEEQLWTQVGDGVWIGVDPADPPAPEELRRRRQFEGYLVELGGDATTGECKYAIPVIRRPDGSSNLPTDLYVDPLTGKLEEPLKERYRRYWDNTANVATWFFTERGFDGGTFTRARALELATEAIGLNYRFGPLEQSVLRLVDSLNFLTILGATVDLQALVAAGEEKKVAPPQT